jgi:hypothetical protein
MAIRKEQEIRLRREVRDILEAHLYAKPNSLITQGGVAESISLSAFSLDDIVDDLMGAINQEDNYRVQDFQKDMDVIRAKMVEEHDAETKALRCQIDEFKAKIAHLQKQIITDEVRKELERKIAILQANNRILKKLVQLSLEEM